MMRIIVVNKPKKLISFSKGLFESFMQRDWFEDPLVQDMILDIDKTKHLGGPVFESPVLGIISPTELSGGVKSLISVYKIPMFQEAEGLRSSMFGDNCAKWLAKLSFLVDFNLYYCHPLDFITNGVDDMSFRYTPLNAVTEFGDPITTCEEAAKYYLENRTEDIFDD